MDEGFVSDDSTCNISDTNSSSSCSCSKDMYLKHVNRNSHKISKPIRKPLPLPTTSSSSIIPNLDPNPGLAQSQSLQPPVYNINKNDFRDVVQKLTGSPAHERFPNPPPPHPVPQSRPPSSRLQKIRPPPLPQISNRPPQLTQVVPRPQNDGIQRAAVQSFMPLPPLPSVHTAAESPISAYMRFLQSSASAPATSPIRNGVEPAGLRLDSLLPQNNVRQGAASPVSAYMRFLHSSFSSSASSSFSLQPLSPVLPQLPSPAASPSSFAVLPLSPLPFGCIPSPRSPYGTLFSPTAQLGLSQVPVSPTLPIPSPMWKGM